MSGARRLTVLLAAVALVGPGCAAAGVEAEAPGVAKERAEIPEVAPIERGGRRYAPVLWGRARGLGQNGGYLAVQDSRTGEEVQLIRIYEPRPDDGREGDKQDVFFVSLSFDSAGRVRIEDELGRVHLVDTRTLAVVRP